MALERLPRGLGRAARLIALVLIVAFGVITLPFCLPALPREPMARYAAAVGGKAATTAKLQNVWAPRKR